MAELQIERKSDSFKEASDHPMHVFNSQSVEDYLTEKDEWRLRYH